MARLAHNDYLQQASDSGWVGFLAYLVWIGGIITLMFRSGADPVAQAGFLGLAGWFSQGLVEFSLYIPALAWTAFTLAGLLVNERAFPPRRDYGTVPPP
jgi:O-antigen ligase